MCVCVFVGVCCVRVVCYVCCVCVLCVCAHAMFMRAYMHVFIIILFVWLKYPTPVFLYSTCCEVV